MDIIFTKVGGCVNISAVCSAILLEKLILKFLSSNLNLILPEIMISERFEECDIKGKFRPGSEI